MNAPCRRNLIAYSLASVSLHSEFAYLCSATEHPPPPLLLSQPTSGSRLSTLRPVPLELAQPARQEHQPPCPCTVPVTSPSFSASFGPWESSSAAQSGCRGLCRNCNCYAIWIVGTCHCTTTGISTTSSKNFTCMFYWHSLLPFCQLLLLSLLFVFLHWLMFLVGHGHVSLRILFRLVFFDVPVVRRPWSNGAPLLYTNMTDEVCDNECVCCHTDICC